MKRHATRTWGMVGISALALILVAAAAEADKNWARIRELPSDQRGKLIQNLRKFDLELSAEKQAAIREMDRRIQNLAPEEQARYYAVLRRFHDWLDTLPENRRDDLLGQSPEERLKTIGNLAKDYPVPPTEAPRVLQVAEVGEFSPFELASAFRIWQQLSASQRKQVEGMPQETGRRRMLFELGTRKLEKPIPRETQPADYNEERWVRRVEEHWKKAQMLAMIEPVGKKKLDQADEAAKTKFEAYRREVLRRQAINLYLAQTEVRSVQPERLSRFVAALPAWIQAAIERYPADDARRRVTFAYRLVFRYPKEIGEEVRPSAPAAKGQAGKVATPKKAGPAAGKRKAVPQSRPEAPF